MRGVFLVCFCLLGLSADGWAQRAAYDTAEAYRVVNTFLSESYSKPKLLIRKPEHISASDSRLWKAMVKSGDSLIMVQAKQAAELQLDFVWDQKQVCKGIRVMDSIDAAPLRTLIVLQQNWNAKKKYGIDHGPELTESSYQHKKDSLQKLSGGLDKALLIWFSYPVFLSPTECLVHSYSWGGMLESGGAYYLMKKTKKGWEIVMGYLQWAS